jgi:hypothetical protein
MANERIIYLVQPFSRGADGGLVFDTPAWSKDRSFAASLSRALSHTKVGVLTVGAAFNALGEVAAEAEILASHGTVPTSLVLPRDLAAAFSKAGTPEARVRRRA